MQANETQKPYIGFVILTWNSEKVIEACLSSVFSLGNVKTEVVLIDNGSTDQTISLASKLSKRMDGNLQKICYAENKGTTISRNEGIRYFENQDVDYLCILDSDTVINTKAMGLLIDEMEAHPQYGIIGPKMVTSAGQVQISARAFPTLLEKLLKAAPITALQRLGEKMEQQVPISQSGDSSPVDYLMSACWLIRLEVVRAAGLLDEKIFYAPEDAEYCIRVWKAGYQIVYCPKATIIHEWQRLSKRKMISKINLEHIKGLAYMFSKHHYLFSCKKLRKSFRREGK